MNCTEVISDKMYGDSQTHNAILSRNIFLFKCHEMNNLDNREERVGGVKLFFKGIINSLECSCFHNMLKIKLIILKRFTL